MSVMCEISVTLVACISRNAFLNQWWIVVRSEKGGTPKQSGIQHLVLESQNLLVWDRAKKLNHGQLSMIPKKCSW